MLDSCVDAQTRIDPGGTRTVTIAEVRAPLQDRFEAYSEQGYRVLGVAVRDVTDDPIIGKDDEQQMTFIGFLLLEDPPKPGALDAIVELRQLGVALKIITGDNRHVAGRMGRHMGLERPAVLTGEELRELSDTALLQRVGEADIFAEIEPNQKERILGALRKAGNVVGYLGDGINDASALHTADVGISVDVAKEQPCVVALPPPATFPRRAEVAYHVIIRATSALCANARQSKQLMMLRIGAGLSREPTVSIRRSLSQHASSAQQPNEEQHDRDDQ